MCGLRCALTLLLVLATTASGCRKMTTNRLVVFASASLAEPMRQIIAEFPRTQSGLAVDLHCAGTPYLIVQAREGAPADVFVFASRESMRLLAESVELAAAPAVFAHNGLAIVVQDGNPQRISGLPELAREGLLVALCGPNVPAGMYAREACRRAGVTVRSCSDEPSVNAVVTKVRLGEIDAGIVYATDLRGADGVAAVAIPPGHDVTTDLVVAIAANARDRAVAAEFAAWIAGAAGRRVMVAHGFQAP